MRAACITHCSCGEPLLRAASCFGCNKKEVDLFWNTKMEHVGQVDDLRDEKHPFKSESKVRKREEQEIPSPIRLPPLSTLSKRCVHYALY